MRLNYAIAFSLIVHSALALPIYKEAAPFRPKQDKPMVVDYMVVKEEPVRSAARVTEARVLDAPRIDIKKPADSKTPASPRAAPARKEVSRESAELSRRQEEVKQTKDYISYYQLIREKIRQRLKDNYRSYYKEGDVHLTFTLNADGSLTEYSIQYQSPDSDRALNEVALASLREASPFPRFPKALNLPRMSFSVIVSFKKR